jgi:hypothetical protein
MSKSLRDYLPDAKWAVWGKLPRRERALQIAAYIVDELRPRETNGNNRGEIVDAIIRQAGYDPADRPAWCACFVTACCTLAGYRRQEIPSAPGAVRFWVSQARNGGRVSQKGNRGDLCYWLNSNGTGHIGFVVASALGWTRSIEGNTGPGEAGNQRDGDGAYRRYRFRTWQGFIRLPE